MPKGIDIIGCEFSLSSNKTCSDKPLSSRMTQGLAMDNFDVISTLHLRSTPIRDHDLSWS